MLYSTTTTTSWGKIEIKPHEQKKKTGTKQERKRRGKTKHGKEPN
jgi:uncharacterized protein YueI